jgi:hypothetical protein
VRLETPENDQILPMPVERLKMRAEIGALKRAAIPVSHPLVEGPALGTMNHQEAERRLRLCARPAVQYLEEREADRSRASGRNASEESTTREAHGVTSFV